MNPSLSVLYIVRNEEKLLKQSLESIVPIADEIVVVDTGSCDGTLQICRQFKRTKILSHSWVHDFSKTKNYGIKQCTKDWIFCIDADEMIDEGAAKKIKQAIKGAGKKVGGFGLHIVDHEDNWGTLPQKNKPFFESPQIRVFRNIPEIRFEGRVQESVAGSIKKLGLATDLLGAGIHHFLWRGKEPSYKSLKLRYYNKLGANFDIPDMEVLPSREPPEPAPVDKVGIVLLAHNGIRNTKACVISVNEHTKIPYELFLVDNGSSDGTADFLLKTTGRKPLRLERNVGVAAGRNKGALEALKDPSVKYICFLDNDTRITPGWLSEMVSVLEDHPEIGLLGPLAAAANGAQNVSGQYPKMGTEAICKKLDERKDRIIKVKEIDRFCMLIRTNVLGSIGLFDESFGLYGYEDYDLCARVRAAGHDVAIANRVYIEHQGGGTVSSHQKNWYQIILNAANKYKEKWKSEPEPRPPSSLGFRRGLEEKSSSSYSHPKTSIVVLTHNRLDVTRPCVTSILENTNNFELVVVDNASTDGTQAWLESIGKITLIRNKENAGVPKARNQGIRASKYEYIVLMDNDVMVRPGWLDELFWEIRNGKDVVGIEAWKLNDDFAATHQCNNQKQEFDYLGGACCLFKRAVFEKAGLLDEGFSPAYYEDVDISVRAKKAGFKLGWKPSPKIKHREHQTLVFGQKDFSYQEQLSRSYMRFAQKMKGSLAVEHEELPPQDKKLNILYLGMQYDYGIKERGMSFEQDNFFPALQQWDKMGALTHFDYVEIGKQHGIPKMSHMLLDKVDEVKPDALFCVFFDENHDPRREVLARISKHTPAITIGWFCDSHWRYGNFDRPWANHLEYCVTTSTVAHEKYLKDGLKDKVIKSQWAASPKYKKIDGTSLDVDISFVGQPHGDRRQVIAALQRAGLMVQFYGTNWQGGRRLSFEEMVLMFNRSKINLNLNNSCDARFKQIKGRNFEVPACGGFLLTGKAENLGDYYEYGKEIATFDDTQDMIGKIKYYLAHEDERRAMADAAYARTMREHTYAHRFDHIFSRAGLL